MSDQKLLRKKHPKLSLPTKENSPIMKKLIDAKAVLFENDDLIAFYKPAGMLAQPNPHKTQNLLDLAEKQTNQKLFVVHRIDQPVSGVMLYGKNQVAAAKISNQLKSGIIKKYYLAFLEKNNPLPPSGRLEHHLEKNGRLNKSFVSASKKAKLAVLEYEVLHELDNYYFVKVELKTGRHHQIRAQFAALGLPIKGDNKYMAKRKNRDRSIHLHSYLIILPEGQQIKAEIPTSDGLWLAVQSHFDA